MSRQTSILLPTVSRRLVEVGQNIRLARQRRQITAELLAERAGMSRTTLRAIEKGDPRVTFAALANVLHSLGLEKDLSLLGRDDELGRKLDDAGLVVKQRVRRKKNGS